MNENSAKQGLGKHTVDNVCFISKQFPFRQLILVDLSMITKDPSIKERLKMNREMHWTMTTSEYLVTMQYQSTQTDTT